jgi:hypothetical protein
MELKDVTPYVARLSTVFAVIVWALSIAVAYSAIWSGIYHLIFLPLALAALIWVAHQEGKSNVQIRNQASDDHTRG